jgi:hypothetical protein
MIAQESRLNGGVIRPLITITLLILLLLVSSTILGSLVEAAPPDGAPGNSGIVHSVVKAPIVPDGDVAGAVTDLVINLDGSMDPAVPGRILPKDGQIRVTHPDDFINTGLPGLTVFTPGCFAPALECSTGVLLQGWPQHPILPMAPPGSSAPTFYKTTIEDEHTLVYTALMNVIPGTPAPGPGIKGMHLITFGFINPGPGVYDIEVEAQTGPGGTWEYGTGRVHILPRARPSINITSVFAGATRPNTIYQNTQINEDTPLPYDFYLWDYDGAPFLDVEIEMVNDKHGLMKQGNAVVGHVRIDAPRGASGQTVSTPGPSTPVNAFLFGVPSARLTAQFTAGDEPGPYTVTFSMNGGNSATMHVNATAE